MEDVLQGYATVGPDWITRIEAISSEQLFAPVIDLLPVSPSRIVDIGAGTGRDAAWLANKGHTVLAVEPVVGLRHAGMELHRSSKITWLDDRLPDLSLLQDGDGFERVLLVAVWQHLNDKQRSIAMRCLVNITASGGMLIMLLRHGRGAPSRPVHQVRPEDTINTASEVGFKLMQELRAESIQAVNRIAGVHWTWLAFSLP